MARAALIDEASNIVVNIIELEHDALWQAPYGHFIRFIETAAIGDVWDGEQLVKPSEA
jgi:hypothetical protein